MKLSIAALNQGKIAVIYLGVGFLTSFPVMSNAHADDASLVCPYAFGSSGRLNAVNNVCKIFVSGSQAQGTMLPAIHCANDRSVLALQPSNPNDGKFTSGYLMGCVLSDGKTWDGQRNRYNYARKVVATATFKDGKATGPFVQFGSNGEKVLEGTLIDQKEDGVITEYVQGRKSRELDFDNGLAKKVRNFDDKGILRSEIVLSGEQKPGAATGDLKLYEEHGKLTSEGPLVEGKRNGLWISYGASGEKTEEAEIKSNVATGSHRTFYSNGKLKCEETLEDAHLVGALTTYDENGKKTTVTDADRKGQEKKAAKLAKKAEVAEARTIAASAVCACKASLKFLGKQMAEEKAIGAKSGFVDKSRLHSIAAQEVAIEKFVAHSRAPANSGNCSALSKGKDFMSLMEECGGAMERAQSMELGVSSDAEPEASEPVVYSPGCKVE